MTYAKYPRKKVGLNLQGKKEYDFTCTISYPNKLLCESETNLFLLCSVS